MITVGNLVETQGGSGATLLAVIVSTSPIYCYFDANESSFLGYRKNANGAGRLEPGVLKCSLTLGGDKSNTVAGWIDFFDNAVNPHSGTIRIRAVFPNEDRSLIPGLFANVRLPAGPAEQVLLIPDTVIASDQGLKSVLLVGANNLIEARQINIGRLEGTMRIVTSGLKPGDRVIDSGQMMMMGRPGMPVEVLSAAPAGAAPAAAPASGAPEAVQQSKK